MTAICFDDPPGTGILIVPPMLHRLRPRACSFIILVSAMTLSTLCSQGNAAPKWLKLEAGDFVVYSNAPNEQIVECAIRYAAFRETFSRLFAEPGKTLPPSTLLLFRSSSEFLEYVPPATPRSHSSTVNFSYEVDGTTANAFALAGDRDQALQFTFEFETIWMIKRFGYNAPVWMSQGAGEVLSTLYVHKGKCVVGDRGEHSSSDIYDWPKFFEISESSPQYRDMQLLGGYLGQAWGLMHWILLNDDNSRERFAAIAQQLRSHSADEAIQTVMATPRDRFTKSISAHFSRFKNIYEANWDEAAVRARFAITPAPEAEVLVQISNLLGASQRQYECDQKLDRARSLAPGLPVIKEAWARRLLREGRRDEAAQIYRDSIAVGSKNFSAYLQSATFRLDDCRTQGQDRAGEGGGPAEVAAGELRQAIRLNPGSVDAYRELGRALFVGPKIKAEDIAELAAGIGAGADGEVVRFYRAALYGRLNRHAEYVADLRAILADRDTPDRIAVQAQSRLLRELLTADSERIEALLQTKDYPSALAIVEHGKTESDAKIREGYDRMGVWLAAQIKKFSAPTTDNSVPGAKN